MATIQTFAFLPFPRRAGQEPVIGLRFPYEETALRERLKELLARYKARVVDPTRHITTAGGWLPAAKAWFVEPAVWPLIRYDLAAMGATFAPIPRPDGVPHYDLVPTGARSRALPADTGAPARTAPPVPPVFRQVFPPEPAEDLRIVDAFITATARMAFSPDHRAGGTVFVRVPAETWDAFHRELWQALRWKAERAHTELDQACDAARARDEEGEPGNG